MDGIFLKFELNLKCLKFKYFLTKTVLYEGFKWDLYCQSTIIKILTNNKQRAYKWL